MFIRLSAKGFHYTILHRELPTNIKPYLYTFIKNDSDRCDCCGLEPKNISYNLKKCDISTEI